MPSKLLYFEQKILICKDIFPKSRGTYGRSGKAKRIKIVCQRFSLIGTKANISLLVVFDFEKLNAKPVELLKNGRF